MTNYAKCVVLGKLTSIPPQKKVPGNSLAIKGISNCKVFKRKNAKLHKTFQGAVERFLTSNTSRVPSLQGMYLHYRSLFNNDF